MILKTNTSIVKNIHLVSILRTANLLPLLFLLPFASSGQDTTQVKLDGTEGEVFRDKKNDTVPKHKYAHWNEFDGPASNLRIGGGFLYEYGGFAQDDASKQQVELSPKFLVRDFRVTLGGQCKFKRDISWKVGIMYDGNEKAWLVRESGVLIDIPEISGKIFVGRTKEGYSISKVMNGYSMWHLERSMSIDIIPILADGIKYLGYLPKPRLGWNIGIYTDWLSEGHSFSTYKRQFISRIFFLPVYTDANKPVLHIGLNYRYGVVYQDELQVKSRPESNPAPFFVDTKKFPVHSSNHIGGEIYFRSGPFLFATEFNAHKMNSPETNNPVFTGGEVFVAYSLTGEVRPYQCSTGIFGFHKVKKSVFDGGPGAWELLLRYSNIDLTDGTLTGGEFWRFTPMVNWYLNDQIRLYFAYGYGVLNKNNLEGKTQFFQTRVLLML